jgi:hypothetical protein
LEELEHIVDDNGLQVDLFLIVEILCLELDLWAGKRRAVKNAEKNARCPCRRVPLVNEQIFVKGQGKKKKKYRLLGPSSS